MKLKVVVCLLFVSVFDLPATVASNEGPSDELSIVGIGQFTRPSLGSSAYGPAVQSSKDSFGGSIEDRRWFANNGFSATYQVAASDADFKVVSAPSPLRTLQFPLTRHEVNGSYVRKLLPHSKLDPYVKIGAGEFFTHGQLGARVNGVWVPQGYLGIDCQFEVTSALGFDLWRTRHFGIRTGYVVHWFRAPNFSDPTYHGARTFITEPQVGFTWKL